MLKLELLQETKSLELLEKWNLNKVKGKVNSTSPTTVGGSNDGIDEPIWM